MTFRDLDRLLRRHVKGRVLRAQIIYNLRPLLDGRERVELVVRDMIPEGGEIVLSDIEERAGLSAKQVVQHLHDWHNEGGITYEAGGPGRKSRITFRDGRSVKTSGSPHDVQYRADGAGYNTAEGAPGKRMPLAGVACPCAL